MPFDYSFYRLWVFTNEPSGVQIFDELRTARRTARSEGHDIHFENGGFSKFIPPEKALTGPILFPDLYLVEHFAYVTGKPNWMFPEL